MTEEQEELSITALVVDDELSILRLLSAILPRSGIEVHTADTTEEGLRLLRANDYGILLTDLNQNPPGTDLYGIALEKGMLAYIMTGHTPQPLMDEAKKLAGKNLLLKPNDLIGIGERIKADYKALQSPQPDS